MKLSEIKGEKALDVLADLIEPLGEIATDKEIAKTFSENRMKAISIAIKNHKQAVLQCLAILEQKPVEEYIKEVNFLTLPVTILEILNDEELQKLF